MSLQSLQQRFRMASHGGTQQCKLYLRAPVSPNGTNDATGFEPHHQPSLIRCNIQGDLKMVVLCSNGHPWLGWFGVPPWLRKTFIYSTHIYIYIPIISNDSPMILVIPTWKGLDTPYHHTFDWQNCYGTPINQHSFGDRRIAGSLSVWCCRCRWSMKNSRFWAKTSDETLWKWEVNYQVGHWNILLYPLLFGELLGDWTVENDVQHVLTIQNNEIRYKLYKWQMMVHWLG